jgi:hypothetical protein
MGRCFIVNPRLCGDKVCDKTRDGAFEDGSIAKNDMLVQDLGLIFLGNNWKGEELC